MTSHSVPTRRLRERPDLDHLKRQAKALLEGFLAGEADAVAEVHAHYRDANPATFALHDAQLAIARAYGFDSWPKLKAYVDGVTVRRLRDSVRTGDLEHVRAMLKVRPELARGALLDAVLHHAPEMVRVLMDHGANARAGVYPHRDATSPLTIAIERGYDDIVTIITEQEQRRRTTSIGSDGLRVIASGSADDVIAMLERNPALIHASEPPSNITPLHVAAKNLNVRLLTWLLDRGADVRALARIPYNFAHGHTALDLAAHMSGEDTAKQFAEVASILLARGAEMTPRAAVALGDADWLRARHAAGTLVNPIEDSGGLLRVAVGHNRPEILALLLDFGFDPDERTRFLAVGVDDVAFTWGIALYHCAGCGKYAMAEMLLERGADPNADVYASGTPMFQAYGFGDWKMVELLTRYGGVPNASTPGLFRQTELARRMIAGEVKYRPADDSVTFAEEFLWGAACGGDPEIVRMALERIDWARDDPRWFRVLEQPLRTWAHGSIGADWDHSTYVTCFRLLLDRSDPNIRGRLSEPESFGLTILHSVAGSREHVKPEERVAFATLLLDRGARLDIRDNLLESTPLGWACRWGREELVRLLLDRGADPIEADAQPWATPRAWATKMGHTSLVALLDAHAGR